MLEPLDDPPVWQQMAEFLCDTGLSGHSLLAELRGQFPHTKRDDVYRALAIAWSYQQAGWLADAIELQTVQDEFAKARARRFRV